MRIIKSIVLAVVFSLPFTPAFAVTIQVVGLFPGAAVVLIDGKRHLLKVGRSGPSGIKLLSADNQRAVLDINGKRSEYGLSRQASSGFSQVQKLEVKVARGNDGHYRVSGHINGFPVRMLVDTGATGVAIGLDQAKAMNIDYRSGTQVSLSTANGIATGFRVTLDRVSVEGLTVRNVSAVVMPGVSDTLLGMSYLRQVTMREENDVLYMQARY